MDLSPPPCGYPHTTLLSRLTNSRQFLVDSLLDPSPTHDGHSGVLFVLYPTSNQLLAEVKCHNRTLRLIAIMELVLCDEVISLNS